MPNWTQTTLTLSGGKEELQRFLDTRFTEGQLDFNTIIPFPDGFDATLSAGSDDIAYDVVHGDWRPRVYPWVHAALGDAPADRDAVIQVYATRYERHADKPFASFQELADAYKRNVDLTGCKTWYEWCNENWGTKWNASNTTVTHDLEAPLPSHTAVVRFSTAWCEPLPVLEALHEQFPSLHMQYIAGHEGDDVITGRKWWPEEDGV